MLTFATIVNFISAYLIASISIEFLVIFVAFFALIVLNLEILSLFNGITDKNILVLSLVSLIISGIFFKFKNAKLLKLSFNFKRFKNSLFLDKSLLLLFGAFIFLLSVTLYLAIFMPVLEPDSQTYHFLRAYEFVKNRSLNHFEAGDIRALIMPINSEIFYAYMLALKKNFIGYGILSYCSFLVCIFSSWKICDFFKFSYRRRLWAIFIFSSLSTIIIQMPSMQTDLLVGSLLVTSFALYLNKKIYFSSLSLALAMGVKSTGIISLLGFFVLILGYEFLINKKNIEIKKFILFLMINFLIFSSYNYILNFIHFHNPLSNQAAFLGHKFHGGLKGYIANLINFAFQGLDFTGFKWGYYLNYKIIALRENIFNHLDIPLALRGNVPMKTLNIFTDEQIVGFGILGFLLFLPMVFISLFRTILNKNKRTIFLGLLAFVFILNILVLARSCGYMIYSIRFVTSFVCLSFLILLMSYKKKSFLKPIFILFCLFYMILISTHISRMPFLRLTQLLKKNNYNLENFSKDVYNAKYITTLTIAPKVIKTIKEKYPNCKKIAYVRGTFSSVIYLKTLEKEGYLVDFINPYNVNDEKLKQYDLVILEKEYQDDNVFNPEDIEINYNIDGKKVSFWKDNELLCYYNDSDGKVSDNIDNIVIRTCLTHLYLKKIKRFKLDYEEPVELNQLKEGINVYYFINQIKD